MVTFLCRSCRFKYTPRTGRTDPPSRCGNCGSLGTIEKEPDAEQILRESNLDF